MGKKNITHNCVYCVNNCNDIIKMQFRHSGPGHTIYIIGPMFPPIVGKVMPSSFETVV